MNIVVDIFVDATEIGLIWSLIALGIFISFRVLDFADLTSEGTVTLGSAIAVSLILKNISPAVATLIAIAGGFAAGAVTGLLHTKLKIPPILAGIISMTGLYSINLRVLGKASDNIIGFPTLYSFLRNLIGKPFLAKALSTLVVVLGVFLILYWFFGTVRGMSVRATGMNQKMARAQGINTDFNIILGLAIANALISLGGALVAQSNKSANMDVGKGAIVIGLAAIIIGEVLFGKKSFMNWMISVILGSIVYQALVGAALTLGFNPNDLKLLQAVLIAFILSMPLIKKWFGSRNGVTKHA